MLSSLEYQYCHEGGTGAVSLSLGWAGGGYSSLPLSVWGNEKSGRVGDDRVRQLVSASTLVVLRLCWGGGETFLPLLV